MSRLPKMSDFGFRNRRRKANEIARRIGAVARVVVARVVSAGGAGMLAATVVAPVEVRGMVEVTAIRRAPPEIVQVHRPDGESAEENRVTIVLQTYVLVEFPLNTAN